MSGPQPPSARIRPATREDLPALSESLAHAFWDDPLTAWMHPADETRLERARRFFGIHARHLLRQAETYTTDDVAGAAVWAAPGRWKTSPMELLEHLPAALRWFGRRLPRVVSGLDRIERVHPKDPPHHYLAMLGLRPEAQGKGLGSALMGPILERCDSEGVGAYLESSKEKNIAFYNRHGFAVTREIEMPQGPKVWAMWRDPA